MRNVYCACNPVLLQSPISNLQEARDPVLQGYLSCKEIFRAPCKPHFRFVSFLFGEKAFHTGTAPELSQTVMVCPSASPAFTVLPVFLIAASTVSYETVGSVVIFAVWDSRLTSNVLTPVIIECEYKKASKGRESQAGSGCGRDRCLGEWTRYTDLPGASGLARRRRSSRHRSWSH